MSSSDPPVPCRTTPRRPWSRPLVARRTSLLTSTSVLAANGKPSGGSPDGSPKSRGGSDALASLGRAAGGVPGRGEMGGLQEGVEVGAEAEVMRGAPRQGSDKWGWR